MGTKRCSNHYTEILPGTYLYHMHSWLKKVKISKGKVKYQVSIRGLIRHKNREVSAEPTETFSQCLVSLSWVRDDSQ